MRQLNKIIYITLLLVLTYTISSCYREDKINNSPQGNYDALWKIIDEKYCYLDVKQIDWDEVYIKYLPRVKERMTNDQLFDLLTDMLAELKDGHVNLSSSFNLGREWSWYEDYPRNFDEAIIEEYLGNDYRISGGVKYKILNDNIGYMYYSSFQSPIGHGNMDHILDYLSLCDGIIIDVRHNGGGSITNSDVIASHFTNTEVLTSYIMHKKGKGHSDFSEPYPITLKPANGIKWQKEVVVLTNRRTYSAANDFANSMRYLPKASLMGDTTGGGGGLPFTSELPNGWSVRFSASPMLSADKEHTEFGIVPETSVGMTLEDKLKGIDTIIETARKKIKKNI